MMPILMPGPPLCSGSVLEPIRQRTRARPRDPAWYWTGLHLFQQKHSPTLIGEPATAEEFPFCGGRFPEKGGAEMVLRLYSTGYELMTETEPAGRRRHGDGFQEIRTE